MPLSANQLFLIAAILVAAILLWIFLLPKLLRAMLGVKSNALCTWRDRVELRYQNMPTSVWMFVWFKLRLDPMFRELPEFLKTMPNIRIILDLGCGYGVAGSALLEWLPDLRLYAIDPNPKRIHIAALAFGNRGSVSQGSAPNFESPALPAHVDAVFVLDVLHYLTDKDLALTLQHIHSRLERAGRLIVRIPIPPPKKRGSFTWHLTKITYKITRTHACFRSPEQLAEIIAAAGFMIDHALPSGNPNPELFWFSATRNDVPPDPPASAQLPHE